ncbi:ester cyclase [Haladaptatus sp. CMAA 1911]|uniref:ester cyclase n=1 Tax=unclassified Haladaptatus TaxID=2622732 RepID=UPI003755356D
MSTDTNEETVRNFVTDCFFNGDPDAVDEYVTDNFVRHGPTTGEVHGADEYKQFVTEIDTAFPEFDGTIDAMLGKGDEVMYRWRADATQKGEFMGIDPTDKTVTMTGMDQVRLEDDHIAEIWGVFDVHSLLEQLEE